MKKILLVDDESSFTRLLKLNLENAGGFVVREENRGSRALAAALEFQPDVILLDLIMPDMDGANIASQIRSMAQLQGVKIFFLTALLTREEVEKHEDFLQATPCIAKPVRVKDVIARINQES